MAASQVAGRVLLVYSNNDGQYCGKQRGAKEGIVSLGRNAAGVLSLQATMDKKTTVAFSIQGGVSIHGRFAHEGKATLNLVQQHVQIQISSAGPEELVRFLTTFDYYLKNKAGHVLREVSNVASTKEKHLPSWCRKTRPPSPVQAFTPISPLSDADEKINMNGDGARGKAARRELVLSPAKRRRITDELTDEQQEVLDAILRGSNVFFTGGAGTGKSFLLRQLLEALPFKGTVATASTGVAACNVGAVTLHSFAAAGNWQTVDRLVIDEISMVDADFFDNLEKTARAQRRSTAPFGGVQVILCGDFLQLPPVQKDAAPIRYCFLAKCWSSVVTKMFSLRESDPEFIDILGRIRLGRHTPADLAKLRSTSRQVFEEGLEPTVLCTHVHEAETHNARMMAALPGAERTFAATDTPAGSKTLEKQCPAAATLSLKVGCQVMLVKNIDQQAGLVNGARGVVVGFSELGMPIVKFACDLTKTMHRELWQFRSFSPAGETVATRKQVPLKLAWAISIHKSQGLTLDCVAMSLSRAFAAGQAYVALSRSRSMEGLCVRMIDDASIRADETVIKFYNDNKLL